MSESPAPINNKFLPVESCPLGSDSGSSRVAGSFARNQKSEEQGGSFRCRRGRRVPGSEVLDYTCFPEGTLRSWDGDVQDLTPWGRIHSPRGWSGGRSPASPNTRVRVGTRGVGVSGGGTSSSGVGHGSCVLYRRPRRLGSLRPCTGRPEKVYGVLRSGSESQSGPLTCVTPEKVLGSFRWSPIPAPTM